LHELLTHEGGLKSYIPFYKKTLDSAGLLNSSIYSTIRKEPFTVEVTPTIFMNHHYIDSMWEEIKASPVSARSKYLYSDLDFYFLKRICEKVSGVALDDFVQKNFYSRLGLSTMSFNPLDHISTDNIVPSNYDFNWRRQIIQGTVHDQGAAMLGGVAGHAGVFSDASDLGILMQMLMNGGQYAGTKFFDSSTVRKFTSQYSGHSRRGLGFDKPEMEAGKASPCCKCVSPETFGHQGFTGTCVWVDPTFDLIYVFLSNRTFPDDTNEKLNTLSVRTKIQQVIYDAIKNAPEN
jgi:beta-N-acetylhexosaminidase